MRDPEADLEPQFRSLLRPLGNARFRRLALEDVLESIRPLVRGAPEAAWLDSFTDKYLLPTRASGGEKGAAP